MRYFPLRGDVFRHDFGVRALAATEPTIEATDAYAAETYLRRELLGRSPTEYFAATGDSLASQQEASEWIESTAPFLSGGINQRTGERIEQTDQHGQALLSIAGHVQEDLVLMRGDADAAFPIIAGAVCFPSGWSIADKLGHGVWTVHETVPEFAELAAEKTVKLLAGLKALRPVWRMNWGVRCSNELDQSPRHLPRIEASAASVNPINAGERCHFRVERQLLVKLASGAVLFTIHTYQEPVQRLTRDQQRRLHAAVQTCPEATLRYKGIAPFSAPLLKYLASRAIVADDNEKH